MEIEKDTITVTNQLPNTTTHNEDMITVLETNVESTVDDDVAPAVEDVCDDVADVSVEDVGDVPAVVEDVGDVAPVVVERNDDVENEEMDEVKNEDRDDDLRVEKIDNVKEEEAEKVVTVIDKEVEESKNEDLRVENIDKVEDEEEKVVTEDDVKVDEVEQDDKEEKMVADEEEEPMTENEDQGEDGDVEKNNEDETMVEEDEEKELDTEMETEGEEEKGQEAEMETENEEQKGQEAEPESPKKGSSGGKHKRGKANPKSPATPRKTIEEDVCFICFDGGDLVLCDRRNCPKAYHAACVNRDEAFFQSKGRWNCGWHVICEKKAEYMCYTCTYSLCKACTKTSVILCVEKEKKGLCEACMKTVMQIENQETQGNANFDDKNSWEHLFKDYWTETKAKHNLSLTELSQAKNPWKGSGKQESSIAQSDVKDDDKLDPNNTPETTPKPRKSRRNAKKQKYAADEDDSNTRAGPCNGDWLSKDLLEFVTHMRNGDTSAISQFEIQDLLLEYIRRNKLRDPNRKSQIICDARLENIFGKKRVAHIEMLKLLESHYLVKEESQIDDAQGIVVDTEVTPVDDKDRKRKGRKKGDRRGPQSNREDYAAIDIHNINLIYLKRKLVEDLLDDMETFHEKIVGTFVRIRISGANQKQDIYRLVQVTGTSEGARYTLSKRTTCTMLEILNLDKTETISIDSISNQEFTEDECKRLRQSIKCGLISTLTVGDVLDKATELQVVKVNDWLETETVRLNHLRDRASDLGRKKELRECVEKLNLLKTPEERARRLEEFPLVHDDPTMDPDCSEDETEVDDKNQESYSRSDSFNRFNNKGRDQFSPRGDYTSKESWGGGTPKTPSSSKNHEFNRNLSNKSFSPKPEDATTSGFQMHTDNSSWDRGLDPFLQQSAVLEKPTVASTRETPVAPESTPKVNETEKMWHYKDPSEKIQGPFSMAQLRRWNKNGYFPAGLKIWRKSDKEDDAVVLNDALEGKFTVINPRTVSHGAQISNINHTPDSRRDFAGFPSPTPNKGTTGWTGGQAGSHAGPSGNDGLQSPTPNSAHVIGASVSPLVPGGNKEANSFGSDGFSTFQPHDLSNPVPLAVAPQNSEQGIQYSVQSSQVAPPNNSMTPQMVQSVSGQNPQGWSGGPPQNLQPNLVMNMAGLQQLAYNQWGGVPNMVQNTSLVGNMQQPNMPQEQWGQFPFPVTQLNMQQPQPQPQPQLQSQPPQPTQSNVSWGTMVPTPNMGWVAPNTGIPMNVQAAWGPMVQGQQVTGTVDPTWAMQTGSVGTVPGNVQAGWVPQPAVPGAVTTQSWVPTPVQGNPGWVGPPGTQVAPNAGWVGTPTVNQGPATINTGGTPPPPGSNNSQKWGSPSPRGRGNWGGNDRANFSSQRRNYNRDPGYRGGGGNRRNFNRQDSFHNNSELNHNDGGSYRNEGRSYHNEGRSHHKDSSFRGGSGDQPARSSDE
nr:zinc finger CCCH domain-containing protein 19-like [Tanacetum cinerariifolium]